jgi:hypothetical protein
LRVTTSKFGRRTAAGICAVGLLAGACSEGATLPAGDGISGVSELSASELRYLFIAEHELVGQCMQEEGFKYEVIPPALEDFEKSAPLPAVDMEERRQSGYGLAESAIGDVSRQGDGAPQDVNAKYIQTLSPERQRGYQRALFGQDERSIEVELPGGGVLATNEDGCLSEARIQLYGDLSTWLYLDHIANNLRSEAASRTRADERYDAVHDEWRSCMEDRGFEYRTPGDAMAAAAEMYGNASADRQEIVRREIQVAVADGECDLSVGLSSTLNRLRQAHFAQVQEDRFGEITGLRELQANALGRARDLLEGD